MDRVRELLANALAADRDELQARLAAASPDQISAVQTDLEACERLLERLANLPEAEGART
jgi:hypothetical protein